MIAAVTANNSYFLVLVIGLLVVVSYAFNILSQNTRIPSVLLLLITGILVRISVDALNLTIPPTKTILEIFGIIGVILIVLEGALELTISKDKLSLIGRSLLSATLTLFLSAALIALTIYLISSDVNFHTCLVNSIPLAVISSAIAIPSVSSLDDERREFIIYESIFSDILGIVLFNLVVANTEFSAQLVGWVALDFSIVSIIAFAFTAIAIYLICKSEGNLRFFLLIGLLAVMYAGGKMLHLSSLILILVFGLIMNNPKMIPSWIKGKIYHEERFSEAVKLLKVMIGESSFLIRTFFFFIFGFSVHLILLTEIDVILTGLMVLVILYGIRFLNLKYVIKTEDSISDLLIAPRGLITILLFYSIPESFKIDLISEGVIFFVILVSSLLMLWGLLRKNVDNYPMDIFIGENKVEDTDKE
jgi:hypothetical protein